MLLDRVDADVAVSADVGVKNTSKEPNFWRIERVRERDLEVEVEYASFVRTPHWACNRGLPMVIR